MKKHVLIFLLSLMGMTAQGQNTFAPLGAEWWYSGNSHDFNFFNTSSPRYWTDHVTSIGDTLINGILCKQLNVERRSRGGINLDTVYVSGPKPLFVYDNIDTVFIYNQQANNFTPLYIFNAQVDDTICLLLPEDVSVAPSGYNTFCFVVDSIKLELFDATYLRSFYTRALDNDSFVNVHFNWGWSRYYGDNQQWVSMGKYTEKIGGNFGKIGGLLPQLSFLNPDGAVGDGAPSGALKCYNDDTFSIKLSNEDCDYVVPTSITQRYANSLYLKVYPNPATDKLSFSTNIIFNDATIISIIDISGRLVFSTTLAKNNKVWTIQLPSLHKGIYVIKAKNSMGTLQQKLLLE